MKKISKLLISIFYTIIFSFSNVGYGEEASELAVAFYSDNDIDSALECLNSISDDTKSARDYLLLGNIYDEKGDKENALNFYKKAGFTEYGHLYISDKSGLTLQNMIINL